MTLDWIDRAFLSGAKPPLATGAGEEPRALHAAVDPQADGVVPRLLDAAPAAWHALADAAAASARAGRPVIAVTGSARGEGRSTVAEALAATLRRRGISVVAAPTAPIFMAADDARVARAASIVIVDAGPWFTPGPLRRAAVERAALGCDAAIVVRRESDVPCPARMACLSDIGLAVLGEALTFVDPSTV